MKTYLFTVTLADVAITSLDMADAIFVAGADDSSVGSREGLVTVDFDREAESLDDAIRSAIGDLAKAGYTAARVELHNETLRLLSA